MLVVWFWVIKEFELYLYSWIECFWIVMLFYDKIMNSFLKLNVLLRVCWLYCVFIIGIMVIILNLMKGKLIKYYEYWF